MTRSALSKVVGAALVALIAGALASSASAAGGIHKFFFGPAGTNTDCEVAAAVPGLGTYAYCVVEGTNMPASKVASVTMSANGKLRICKGGACGSDAPEQTPTLKVGQSVNAAPFRCTGLPTGTICVVVKTGAGFLIDTSGVTRLS